MLAFRVFFALLFTGTLSPELLAELGLQKKQAAAPAAPTVPRIEPTDGALQLIGILQRDARILDFFMEDISPYTDEQVGTAAREIHEKTREVLTRHLHPVPVMDAVEGTPVDAAGLGASAVKFVGNLPATGSPRAGLLRHKGWKSTQPNLPKLNSRSDLEILAPVEIEVE